LKGIIKIESGGDFNICLDNEGNLYSWGSNRYGQLGITGTNTYKINKPMKINLPHGVSKVIDFSCGEEHAAILTEEGKVFTWGYGNDG
jgi:alpha-tubulin suppressor-like RCC1 family protein